MFLLLDNYDSFTWNLYQAIASSLIAKNGSGDPQSEITVVRNDKISVDEVLAMQPRGIVISPGPGRPEDAGISLALIDALLQERGSLQVDPCLQEKQSSVLPSPALLGVCLGMQCLAQSCGAKIVRAKKLMHGKISEIKLTQKNEKNAKESSRGNAKENSRGNAKGNGRANPLFLGLPQTLKATRYHSLVVEPESLPSQLNIDAYSEGYNNNKENNNESNNNDTNNNEPVIMALSHKKLDLFGVQFHPESIACEHGSQLLDNFVTFCLDRR